MAKSMKYNKKSMKKSMKKSHKGKRRRTNKMRKNIKRISLTKLKRGHSKKLKHHYSRGHHKSRKMQYGAGCGCGSGSPLLGGKKMKGGMVSSPSAGPVGYSWDGSNESTWPGVAVTQGTNTQGTTMSNHFSLSPNGVVVGGLEPAKSTVDSRIQAPKMHGGKRKGRKNMKGGFYQEILNLGRGVQYGLNGGYYDLMGKNQPLSENPYPTQGQPINKDYMFIGSKPADVRQIYIDANNKIAKV